MFACTKIVRILSSPMAILTSFVGIPNMWLVGPIRYGDKCRGNCLVYCVVNMNNGLFYNSANFKDTKQY